MDHPDYTIQDDSTQSSRDDKVDQPPTKRPRLKEEYDDSGLPIASEEPSAVFSRILDQEVVKSEKANAQVESSPDDAVKLEETGNTVKSEDTKNMLKYENAEVGFKREDADDVVKPEDGHWGGKIKTEEKGASSEVKREESAPAVAAKLENTNTNDNPKVEDPEDIVKIENTESQVRFDNTEDKVKTEDAESDRHNLSCKTLNDVPQVVIKKETMATEEVVQSRLAHIRHHSHPVDLGSAILDVTATRELLSSTFGGDAFSTFPRVSPAWFAKHGMNDFAYPNLTHNPHAPWRPGAPGLLFALTLIPERERTLRIIVGLRPKAWQYMGQYVLVLVPQLSREEWLAQSEGFKQVWINYAFHHDRAKEVRIRIHYHRREHREPSEDELAQAIASRNKYGATREEIRKAYDLGEQRVYVWCMKCIDYDVNFQTQIAEKLQRGQHQRGQTSPRRSKRKRA